MNKIINKYLIINYFKIFLNTVLVFFALGLIMNLFEEIEFFKELDVSIFLPILLSFSSVPALMLELLPFITFLSAVFFLINFKSSKDLLVVKIFGYSNFKIISILSSFTFILGIIFIIAINPITSSLTKYYEITKAKYSDDLNHLISINKNGLWIKEQFDKKFNIINAQKLEKNRLINVSIYEFNENSKMVKRIDAESAIIFSNPWVMNNVAINEIRNGSLENYEIYLYHTDRTLEKISSLYKNLDTISFLELTNDYKSLIEKGYSIEMLNQKINNFIILPINLFLMIVLASIFTINSLNVKTNFYYIIISIIICVCIYYFNDLSLALGQTEKINGILSVWMPSLIVGLFCSIGVIQINEK